MADITTTWSKDAIRSLRLRLGWSQSDLARRLNCSSTEIELWEAGSNSPTTTLANELVIIAKHAEACSNEVHHSPMVENLCDQQALEQIEFSEIKDEIE